MPGNIQVVLLSATMPSDVLEVTKRFMRDPARILVKKEELTLEGIKQFYILIEREVTQPFFYVHPEVTHIYIFDILWNNRIFPLASIISHILLFI